MNQQKEHLYSYGAVIGGIIILDYLVLCHGMFAKYSFAVKFPITVGYMIRPLWVFIIWLLTNTGFRYKFKDKKDLSSVKNKILSGLLFISSLLILIFIPKFPVIISTVLYPIVLILSPLASIYATLAYSSKFNPNMGKGDLSPEKEKNDIGLSFCLKAKGGWVNIVNPFRGIGIIGSNGSGKTASWVEPIIAILMEKNFSGLLYDVKFPELSNVAYTSMLEHNPDASLWIVNFTDLTRSHRVNPIDPKYLKMIAYADEFTQAIFNNLNPELIQKGDDFWSKSSKAYFQSVMWFLKKHHPEYCTLPHVIAICLNENLGRTLEMLKTDHETKGLVASILTAFNNKSSDQLSGVVSSTQISLTKLNTPEVFWVLSGNDFDLNLNDPQNPKFLCIGSSLSLVDSLAPVISVIITVASKNMNQPKKHHSCILIDEFPTLYIPKIEQIPATARSHKVCLALLAQDFSQVKDRYGDTKKDAIWANLNYQIYGRISHDGTIKHIKSTFGKEDRIIVNKSSSNSSGSSSDSSSSSVSENTQERDVLKEQDIQGLAQGEFVGTLVETKKAFFRAQMEWRGEKSINEIPVLAINFDVHQNFDKIYNEAVSLLSKYDPNIKDQMAHIDSFR